MRIFFSTALLKWFDEFGRKNLPWQKIISPYSVWISEIMLQQTQVTTVIPYFEKFISHFPHINLLAQAQLDEVLHLWTGLGYYARARNLHKAAKIITYEFNSLFPDDLTTLISLPGIGRSTAGAILSIAFHKATPILDGNVKRVLARYHAIVGHPGDKTVENKLWRLASEYTPEDRCADYTQAIMDLGATVCTRVNPKCGSCPLQTTCVAHKENKTGEFPDSKKKPPLPIKNTQFLILRDACGALLLEKRPPVGLWGGLWSFPEYQKSDILTYCSQKFGYNATSYKKGNIFRHTFSHFHLDITPIYIDVKVKKLNVLDSEVLWCSCATLPKVGLAAPVKNLLQLNFLEKE